MATPSLNLERAESSRQHVRALNTQFASWVQTQLKNHPDELWEDGARDYLAHASSIMEKFTDVVCWLKANAAKGEGAPAELQTAEKKNIPETKNTENKLFQAQTGIPPVGTTTSFGASWSSGTFFNNQNSTGVVPNSHRSGLLSSSRSSGGFSNSQGSGVFSSSQSFGIFSTSQSSGVSFNSQSSGVSFDSQGSGISFNSQSSGVSFNSQGSGVSFNSQSSGVFSNSQSSGVSSNSQNSVLFSNSQSPGLFSSNQSSGLFSNNQSSGLFSNSQSPGLFSNSQSPGLFSSSSSPGFFSSSQSPVSFGNQSLVPTTCDASNDVDGDNEEAPSSPSLKKSEEQGVVVVHEVKCKLYVKSNDPADKDPWKDKGTGQLSIKCKEGVSKGTKESKPTILVRNDVGKLLLNALIYPGIKTNSQKNSIVAIFHTAGDGSANDGGDVVARTFLIRLKTEDDRNKLATAIQDCAPSS
ncbi:nucleoporin NUP100/NSP100 isoform X2 [Humulus lupulus]|nr:nucleoporin NUP100/NSP100 isoform X2 [Humulus lupulus]